MFIEFIAHVSIDDKVSNVILPLELIFSSPVIS